MNTSTPTQGEIQLINRLLRGSRRLVVTNDADRYHASHSAFMKLEENPTPYGGLITIAVMTDEVLRDRPWDHPRTKVVNGWHTFV